STGDVLGTVDYVAPELFEEHRRADASSDLYSLGVLLYEMVTGRLPFTAESQLVVVSMHMNKRPPSPRNIVPTISSQIERVVYKALEKRPEQRYASATELEEAFCHAVTSNRKGKEVDSVNKPKVEQGEVAALPEVTSESITSSVTPVAPLDTLTSQSPQVNTGVGHQFKSPQADFKISPLQPELPLNSVTPSPTREDFRHPNRNRWIAVFLTFLALMILVTSVVSIVLQRTNYGHTIMHTTA